VADENLAPTLRAQAKRPTRFLRGALLLLSIDRAILKRGDFLIERRALGAGAINFIETRGHQVIEVLFDELSNCLGVELAARYTQSMGKLLG